MSFIVLGFTCTLHSNLSVGLLGSVAGDTSVLLASTIVFSISALVSIASASCFFALIASGCLSDGSHMESLGRRVIFSSILVFIIFVVAAVCSNVLFANDPILRSDKATATTIITPLE